jgi:DNA-binding SARP family transcriptional activator/tetratricopeptide (TPR) repeat protein
MAESSERAISGLSFAVLGSVRVWRDGVELDLGSPQQRLTLAVLLLARGRVVPVSEIIDALWADEVPVSARGTVRTYVHRLRRVLGGDVAAEGVLRSAGSGYQLRVEDQALDLGRLLLARQVALEARAGGDPRRAVELLHKAMAEWQAEALAGLSGEWAERERMRLRRLGVQAGESLAELELQFGLGDRAELVERLASLADAEPLRERVHELLMLALCQSGRGAEALTAFERLRVTLREELGVDPGPALRQLHERILRTDDDLPPSSPPASLPSPMLRPAQLPAALTVFSGRQAELTELSSSLGADSGRGVGVVFGTAGVGKTTLAVYWANRVASSFPDGQLYINLRGFEAGGVAREPEEVLGELLSALGVPTANQPGGLDARSALYRSVLADKRMLILLDNARADAQVLPLLPGGGHCLALVTSRVELAGLVAATGAYTLKLDQPDEQESVDFVASRLGRERVAAEPQAVREIAVACARLPLALAVVCARIAANRQLALSDVADELAERTGNRLDALEEDDPNADPRSLLSWSYHALPSQAARLFRLLALLPAAEFTLEEAASLVGVPLRQAHQAMRELTRACVVMPHRGRYSWHDLLRDYATELLDHTESEADIIAAHRRLLDHYLVLAHAGAAALEPRPDDQPPLRNISEGVLPGPVFDEQSARKMFAVECDTMLTLIERAAGLGFEQHCWYLTWYLRRYQDSAGRIDEMATCGAISLRAAESTNDYRGIGYIRRILARVAWWRGDSDASIEHLDEAINAFATAQDRLAEAYAQNQAIDLLFWVGRNDEAFHRIELTRTLIRGEDKSYFESVLMRLEASYHLQAGHYQDAIEAARIVYEHHKKLGKTYDLLYDLDLLSYVHTKLGDYNVAIACIEERIELLRRSGESAGPSYLVSLHGKMTLSMAQLVPLTLAVGEHVRAETRQRELLQRLRHVMTDPLCTTNLGSRAADAVRAALADLDRLIAVSQPDPEWYTACEAILLRVTELVDPNTSRRTLFRTSQTVNLAPGKGS